MMDSPINIVVIIVFALMVISIQNIKTIELFSFLIKRFGMGV